MVEGRTPSSLGVQLEALRKRKGISARELARRARLSESHIRQIEIGTIRDVKGQTIAALCKALKVGIGRLVVSEHS